MDIRIDGVDKVAAMLVTIKGELPKVAERSQNALVYQMWLAEKEQMRVDIDRPTPWSVGALRYKKVGKPSASEPPTDGAAVYMADGFKAGSRVGAKDWLGVQILGGKTAGPKRSERLMQSIGILRPDHVWVPDRGVKLDAYGNVKGSTMSALITDLGLNPYARTKDKQFCLIGKPPVGVLARVASGGESLWLPFLWFVPRKTYRERFGFYRRAEKERASELPGIINEQLRRVLDSAKR